MTNQRIIFIDGTPLVRSPHTGVSNYTVEVARELASNHNCKVLIILFKNETIPFALPHLVESFCLPIPRRLYMAIWRVFPFWNVLPYMPFKPDWVLYANFSMTPHMHDGSIKTATVIHDLTYIHYPETVEKRNRYFLSLAVKRSCRQSDIIITPSQATADDVAKHFTVRRPIVVAYPGHTPVSAHLDSVQRNDITSLKSYVLFIGTIEPRKNIRAICDAYLESHFYQNDIELVVAGKPGWGDVKLPDNPHIIQLGQVSNQEKEYLLRNCVAFVFPSLFEGFGIPVVEAMYHKKPVITSDTSSLKEIANSTTAYMVDTPYDATRIKTAMDDLYEDLTHSPQIVAQKIEQSYSHTEAFTWTACEEKIYQAYCDMPAEYRTDMVV